MSDINEDDAVKLRCSAVMLGRDVEHLQL